MQVIDRIALILAIIGGLNWGSIGLFRFGGRDEIDGDTEEA